VLPWFCLEAVFVLTVFGYNNGRIGTFWFVILFLLFISHFYIAVSDADEV
jgi:cell division protein FtsW (lipid II flippase)